MAKDFKTVEELILLLEDRGVKTDSSTGKILQMEGYYAIINGYKDPFLDRKAMQGQSGDAYIKGTTFSAIYDLFLFDRDMRGVVFPYLTMAETILKNAIVYAFCDRNRETTSYLERSNYATAKDMLVPVWFKGDKAAYHSKNLADLMRRLNNKLKLKGNTPPFIRHYIETYGDVPLWVLQNDLTFGNIEHFYQLQQRGVQNTACRIVSQIAGHGKRIGARELLHALNILVGFRNICAHGDRYYCASVKGCHTDKMLNALDAVLPRDRLARLTSSLMEVTNRYKGKIDPRALSTMYTDSAGIPMERK